MNYSDYGNKEGRKVVYFHGTPGSIDESAIFDKYAKLHNLNIICFERFSIPSSLKGAEYHETLFEAIKAEVKSEEFDVIAFSIGCHIALKQAPLFGKQMKNLHLISAAAPLESGDYLNDMAGGIVFTLAMRFPRLFWLLTKWQSLLINLSPNTLFKMLFASAKAKDKRLLQDPSFKLFITSLLRKTYSANLAGYLRDVTEYVKPWADSLTLCEAETYVWHGIEDNWSPFNMAEYLFNTIPTSAKLTQVEEASHYSCLFESVEPICKLLDQN
jgi:pimeloyl-ACP methyl ester carboxylesterase